MSILNTVAIRRQPNDAAIVLPTTKKTPKIYIYVYVYTVYIIYTPVRVLRHGKSETVVERALLPRLDDVQVTPFLSQTHVRQAGGRGRVALHLFKVWLLLRVGPPA